MKNNICAQWPSYQFRYLTQKTCVHTDLHDNIQIDF